MATHSFLAEKFYFKIIIQIFYLNIILLLACFWRLNLYFYTVFFYLNKEYAEIKNNWKRIQTCMNVYVWCVRKYITGHDTLIELLLNGIGLTDNNKRIKTSRNCLKWIHINVHLKSHWNPFEWQLGILLGGLDVPFLNFSFLLIVHSIHLFVCSCFIINTCNMYYLSNLMHIV